MAVEGRFAHKSRKARLSFAVFCCLAKEIRLRTTAMTEPGDAPTCPLCSRPIPAEARQSVHHLVPKLKGGAKGPTVLLHEICHRAIQENFTESQLARDYASIEALKAHPAILKFVRWVSKKDPTFHAPTLGPGKRPGRRSKRK